MKIKAIIILLLCFTINIAYSRNTYYCPENNGSYLPMRDVYNPEEDCKSFKDDFFLRTDPNAYQSCLKQINTAKQKYLQGKCEPIITKTHNFGSTCKGEAMIAPKAKRVLQYGTFGGECMKELKLLYKEYEF